MGILPINLGPAKLQKSEHTFVHVYDIEPLILEYNNLNAQYEALRLSTLNNSIMNKDIDNYKKIIEYTSKTISEKLSNFKLQQVTTKNKRGLINGLGTIIRTITGNLDAEDEKKFNKILKHMQENQSHLQNQLKLQYSVSQKIVDNFNDTIKSIQHNESILKQKILVVNQSFNNFSKIEDMFFANEVFNQLILLYNTILNVLRDIENSVTFCKLKTIHPSIIKSNELFDELKKISFYYKEQFPFEIKLENILDFESIIKINCKIEPTRISYFLSIPIDFEQEFELFYFHPLPTKHESEFVTVIPNVKYLLKSNEIIKPLNDVCTKGKIFQCPSYLQTNHKTTCEEQVLLNGDSSHCQFIKLKLDGNHMEIIPEINQYLAVFPEEGAITIKCQAESETKALIGIYLIKENGCKTFFNNHEITYQEKTYGKPLLNSALKPITFTAKKIPNLEIKLETLNLKEIPINPIVPIFDQSIEYHIPSIWTVFLYIVLAILLISTLRKWYLKKNQKKKSIATIELQEQNLHLPEGASF